MRSCHRLSPLVTGLSPVEIALPVTAYKVACQDSQKVCFCHRCHRYLTNTHYIGLLACFVLFSAYSE